MSSKLRYVRPLMESLPKSQALNLLVSFSLEGEVTNLNGGHTFVEDDDYSGSGLYDDSFQE